MTSKPRWGYKRSAMVLRPWIVRLLVWGDLKQRAQKVQVLQNVRGPPRQDGSVMKELTDGQAYIKAIFTAEALKHYHDKCLDDSSPPSINDALLILNDYEIEFIPKELSHWCEFAVVVKRFTLWSYQEGFGLKHSPVNSMANDDVKKKAVVLWKQWRENQAKGASLDTSLSSMPLTQLLEEMGMETDSPVIETENDPEEDVHEKDLHKVLETPDKQPRTSSSNRTMQQLSDDVCIEDFIICESEEEILASISEWQSDYVPEPTPSSGSKKSSESVSPKPTLRKDVTLQKYIYSRIEGDQSEEKNPNADNGDRTEGTLDAGIQVSQSLWEDFLRKEGYTRKDNSIPAGRKTNRTVPASPPTPDSLRDNMSGTGNKDETSSLHEIPEQQDGIHNNDSLMEVLHVTPHGPQIRHELSNLDHISPSLLSSPENNSSKKLPSSQEYMVIDDSFEREEEPAKAGNNEKVLFERNETINLKHVYKDPNDKESAVVIDITSSQELSSNENDVDFHGINSVVESSASPTKVTTSPTKRPLVRTKLSKIVMEEKEEEDRLFRLRKCSKSHDQERTNNNSEDHEDCENLLDSSMIQNREFANISETRRPLGEKSKHHTGKRRLSLSDSEISSTRKVFVVGQKENLENCTSKRKYRFRKGSPAAERSKTNVSEAEFTNSAESGIKQNYNSAEQLPLSGAILATCARKDRSMTSNHSGVQCSGNPKTTRQGLSNRSADSCNENETSNTSNLLTDFANMDVSKEKNGMASNELNTPIVLSGQSELNTSSYLNDAQIISSGEPVASTESSGDKNRADTPATSPSQQNSNSKNRTATNSLKTPINSLPSYQPPRRNIDETVTPSRTPSHSVPLHEGSKLGTSAVVSPIHSLLSYKYRPQQKFKALTESQKSSEESTGCQEPLDESFWGVLGCPPVSSEGQALLEMSFPDHLMKKIELILSGK